jgi:hypothetical protein
MPMENPLERPININAPAQGNKLVGFINQAPEDESGASIYVTSRDMSVIKASKTEGNKTILGYKNFTSRNI